MTVIDPLLWWTGLRALLILLCRPHLATRIAQCEMPSTYLSVLRSIAQTPKADFAVHPIGIRHDLLRMASWLVKNWPLNFISTMKAAGLTASSFNFMEFHLPYWLQSVARTHLDGKRYRISEDEAHAASIVLSRSQRPLSKIALKRQLGVTEGKALDVLRPPRLKKLPDDTIQKIIVMLDKDIDDTPSSREEQSSALRDACCIAASIWLGISFTKVCDMTSDQGQALNKTWHSLALQDLTDCAHATRHAIVLARIFCQWGDLYANGVRQRFCRYNDEPVQYFVTRFGRAFLGFSLAARFAELLRRVDVDDWSAGARFLVSNGIAKQLDELSSLRRH